MASENISDPEEKWDSSYLTQRLCHVLDIARDTIRHLSVQGFSNPDDPNNIIRPEKVIGETALLLLIADSFAGEFKEVRLRIKDLAIILIPHARNEKIFLEICLQPALAMEYAQAHICLSKIGYPDGKFDTLLIMSINAQAHYGRERPPHRTLEQEWIKKIWNHSSRDTDSIDHVIAHSALARPVDLLHCTKDDMYAFTHALMYATNFNIFPWELPRERSEILAEADAMLAKCLDEQDYDLAGELLLAWPLTGSSWSATSAFAFRVLLRVDKEAGFLPSPSTRLETLQKLDGEDRKKYLLATAYHTVYVMGLLCAVALQPGRVPPKHIPGEILIPGIRHKILPFLDHNSQHAHWFEEFNTLTGFQQDALTGFLLNVVLISNVRQSQYGIVYELLRISYEMGMADTVLASQTAELLQRLSLLSSLSSFEKQ